MSDQHQHSTGAGDESVDRVVDGVRMRTYRGASLAEIAPRVRDELGDGAMILRTREGVTGGIAGFFAKACVEVDVALIELPGGGRIDTIDGPAVGPPKPVAREPRSVPAVFEPLLPQAPIESPEPVPAEAPAVEPVVEIAPAAAEPLPVVQPPAPAVPAVQAVPTAPPAPPAADFEARLRAAGLTPGEHSPDPVQAVATLRAAARGRGLPEPLVAPAAADVLAHRLPLEPGADPAELLADELSRRIPASPITGRTGRVIALVGTAGSGRTRAIARLAAAYASAGTMPVACVTLRESGDDGLLAATLAPHGVPVHAAPDTATALDRITALRRDAIVLVDTPGVSPSDVDAVRSLGGLLELLELDTVALCLPVTLAPSVGRKLLRSLRPLGPTALIATHADEADLLGAVVAVAIDQRTPLAYVSSGAGEGSIAAANPRRIAAALLAPAALAADEADAAPAGEGEPPREAERRPQPAAQATGAPARQAPAKRPPAKRPAAKRKVRR